MTLPGSTKIVPFSAYIIRNNIINDDGEYFCPHCEGVGKIYNPDDPRCPIEGNKMRGMITCPSCMGSKASLSYQSKWKEIYKKAVKIHKLYKKAKKDHDIRVKQAIKKLTKEDRKVLGLYAYI